MCGASGRASRPLTVPAAASTTTMDRMSFIIIIVGAGVVVRRSSGAGDVDHERECACVRERALNCECVCRPGEARSHGAFTNDDDGEPQKAARGAY